MFNAQQTLDKYQRLQTLGYHPHDLQGGPRKCNIHFWYGQNASFRNSATRDC